ncbi:hypothetical protein GCM10023318_06200 [Nocardia callitridis]|uniref:Uncharacterized protein n=1 Tax=Nocardia callitridis TaxID=648753 RepID=A0ABP9JTH4_9NOCA
MLQIFAAGDIDLAGDRAPTLLAKVRDNRFESIRTTGGEHDGVTTLAQQSGGGGTDTAACTGDGDNFRFGGWHEFPFER